MPRKSLIIVLLSILLVLGTAAAASADPGKGKLKANGPAKKVIQLNDIQSHWAEQPIRSMYLQGIILGYPDLSFRPNTPVSKYEAVMMISRATGYDGKAAYSGLSWNSDGPSWMKDCLDYAVKKKILTESEARNLNGWQPAKRYEVAVWAVRALGLEKDDRVSFQDLKELPPYAIPFVGGMYKHSFMVGYPGNKFQPNKPVTRAEMAQILYRIMLDKGTIDDDDDDVSSLSVTKLSPAGGATNVSTDTINLKATFSEEISPVVGLDDVKDGISVTNTTDDVDVAIEKVTISGKVLTIKLEDYLKKNKSYRITIDGGILEDGGGEEFDGLEAGDWEFSTGTAASTYGAEIVSHDLPATMMAGQTYEVKVRVRNTGDGTWTGKSYCLGAVGGSDPFGPARVCLSSGESIEPGKYKTFTITMKAPSTTGTYTTDWRMVRDGSRWFGETLTVRVKVVGFKIISLSPADGAANVTPTRVLKARFSSDIEAVSGKSLLDAITIENVSESQDVEVAKVAIENDTLVITLEDSLVRGDTYEVSIGGGYLKEAGSGVKFEGIDGSDWRFTIRN